MNGEKKYQRPWKTMPKFGNGNGNWSKMKDLLYSCDVLVSLT